jgi:hypothetical protein
MKNTKTKKKEKDFFGEGWIEKIAKMHEEHEADLQKEYPNVRPPEEMTAMLGMMDRTIEDKIRILEEAIDIIFKYLNDK